MYQVRKCFEKCFGKAGGAWCLPLITL